MSRSLVGRNVEIDAILELVRGGGSLVVTGPPGIGKSSLLLEAEHAARARGMGVLSASGVQSETHLPYAGLHQLLRPMLDGVDRLPRPQRDALEAAFGLMEAEPPDLFLVGLGTLNLLTAEATNDGLLLIAEDGQWLDHGTGEVLAFVARRLGTDPVSLLIALREGHESPLAVAGLSEMRLGGLDEVAATQLLRERVPDLPPSVCNRLLEESAGNALALVELPAALASDQLAGTVPLPVVLPLTERLERAFASRVRLLPPGTRAQLLIAALNDSGDIGEVLRASAVGDKRPGDIQTLEDAAAAGLVDLDPTTLRFRHPLVRSAVVQMVSDAERRAAHRSLADVLVNDPDRRAWHRAASIVGADDDVASQLEAAAARAERRGGIAVAVAGLERAAELSGDVGARGRRLMHAADLAFELGRRDLLGRLLQLAERLELGELERGRMTWIQEMVAPRIPGPAQLHSLIHLADRSRSLGDRNLATDVLWLAAQRCYWSAPGEEIRAGILKAAASLGSLGDDPRLVAIVAYAAPIEHGSAVVDHVYRAVGAHHETPPETTRLLGTAAAVVGAYDLATGLLASSAGELRTRGRLGHLARVLVIHAWADYHLGDWDAASMAAEEGRSLASETRDPLWGAGANVVQALIAALSGDAQAAGTLAADVERTALPSGVSFLLAAAQTARGLSALGGGRHAEAYEHLRRSFDPLDPTHHPFISTLAIGDLAEAAARSDRSEEAQAIVEELSFLGTLSASPRFESGLRYARAVLADDQEAEALYHSALDADLTGWPFDRARLLLAYGEWLRRRRRVVEARAPLRSARDAFDALGALAWGERARQELRASGEKSRPRTPEARERLTPQELQIAQMAAEGLSNREIGHRLYLSHRTVGTHLYRIFPKLGISARSQLRDALLAAGSVT